MIFGYIRVSTDMQTVENQRFEINNYCARNGMAIDEWIEDEGVSGAKDYNKRALGPLIQRCKDGDLILCSEISRLGRDLLMIMEILNTLMKHNVKLYTIKDNFRLGDDMQCKVLAFAFGLAAEIERKLISQRTKEALARLKAEGKVLGRPRGVRNEKWSKLCGHEEEIRALLESGVKKLDVCRRFGCDRATLLRFLKISGMEDLVGAAPRQFEINADMLRAKAEAGLTVAACARALGVNAGTIKKYAEIHGIEFGRKTSIYDQLDEMKEEIEERLFSGETSQSIRKDLGVVNSAWCTWLHRNGLSRSQNADELRARKGEVSLLFRAGNSPKTIGEALGFATKVVEQVLGEMELRRDRELPKEMRDLAEANGIPNKVVSTRLSRGWTLLDACSKPIHKRKKKD